VERIGAQRRDQAHLGCGAGRVRDGATGLLPLVLVRRLSGCGLGSLPRHLVGGSGELGLRGRRAEEENEWVGGGAVTFGCWAASRGALAAPR
jgi:hypothetical protein